MDKYIREIPVVKVFQSKDGVQYYFWCSFCKRFHYHGAAALGHRLPHCINQNSAYLGNNGYILEQYTQKELRELGLPPDHYSKHQKKQCN